MRIRTLSKRTRDPCILLVILYSRFSYPFAEQAQCGFFIILSTISVQILELCCALDAAKPASRSVAPIGAARLRRSLFRLIAIVSHALAVKAGRSAGREPRLSWYTVTSGFTCSECAHCSV